MLASSSSRAASLVSTLVAALAFTATIATPAAAAVASSPSSHHLSSRQQASLHHARAAALEQRDASTIMSGGTNNEGELHTPLTVPAGAKLKSLDVGNNGDQLTVYWPNSTSNKKATAAYVMIHGRTRNGNDYWTVMNDALQSALKDNYPGVDPNTIVTAPQFFSTIFNSGQYDNNTLAWGDVNAWQAGEVATHPNKSTSSSFDALDAFIDEFSNSSKYPNMKNITLVGHGGGGQLMARYAMVGKDAPSNVWIRMIVGDPSSNAYFTLDRPSDVPASVANKSSCPAYNEWRYGFDNVTTFTGLKAKPIDIFTSYIKKDLIQIIGYQDVDDSGDQYCMAMLQGGQKRRDRNLSWWRYINTLARTNFDVSGFPGEFDNLPDWSNISLHQISHRLIVVEDADHDAALVFGSPEGRAALFDVANLPTGWRPTGWNANGTGQYTVGTTGTSGSGKNPKPSTSSTNTGAAAPGLARTQVSGAVLGGMLASVAAVVSTAVALL
ncbi:hypothetical protein OC846_002856 [Tilletia horrida]|uniref:AB hydrolase-1 domain-containing protein n=1 Tax=Tilletia horrida TaxID=155126 RepID=A0AAN6JRS8_9BASI|nr:hypothetical protein OC846_002856 [Tilletia horrida]KAK0568641.1 hypothetical protein OC861_001718 [Tilletia horrida]